MTATLHLDMLSMVVQTNTPLVVPDNKMNRKWKKTPSVFHDWSYNAMRSDRCIILKAHRKWCVLLAGLLTAAQPGCWQCHCRRWNTKPFLEASSGKLLVSRMNWAVFCGAVCWSQSSTALLSQFIGLFVQEINTSPSLIGCFHFLLSDSEDLDWKWVTRCFLGLLYFSVCFSPVCASFHWMVSVIPLFVLFNSWEVVCAAAGWHLSHCFNLDECLLWWGSGRHGTTAIGIQLRWKSLPNEWSVFNVSSALIDTVYFL